MRNWMIVVALSASALWGQKVHTEADQKADFASYKKYLWREHPLVAKHPEVRRFTTGSQLVMSDVNDILMNRGYVPVEEKPDFIVTFFVTAREGKTVTSAPIDGYVAGAYGWPMGWYAWNPVWFSTWETTVRNYVKGILLLDIVDAKTNMLVWRAVGSDEIDDFKNRDKNIAKVVEKALKQFPPKVKK